MPTFDFTSPDGKSYSVQGPDGATPEQAFQILQTQIGGGSAPAPAAPAPDIGENRESAIAALRGIPIVGAYADKGAAALNAALQPVMDGGLSKAGTFGDRMAENEKTIKSATDAYEASHPIGTTAGKMAMGTLALAPAMAAAPEAFGLGAGSLLARSAAGAASGGIIGGADAAARGDDIAKGAGLGAVTGGVAPAVGQTVGRMVGKAAEGVRDLVAPKTAVEVPSTESIKDAATSGYDALRDSGVQIKPEAVQGIAQKLQQDFHQDGFRDYLAPKTFGVIDELAKPAPEGAFASFSDLHGIRRALGKAAQSIDPTEKAAASKAISTLDDYLQNIPAGDVIAGDADAAAKQLGEANANYSAAKSSELLQRKIGDAELQAGSANSGANLDNALRQRVKDILKSPKLRQGYKQDELLQMQRVVRGSAPANMVRTVGNMLGGGGGLGALLSAGAGALAEGPIGLAAPLVGMAAKKIGNRMTESQLAKLDQMIRLRAPFSEQAKSVRGALEAAKSARLAKTQQAATLVAGSAAPALAIDLRGNRR